MRDYPIPFNVARFWAKVDKSGVCWLWTGACYHSGHGMLKVGGRRGRLERAHRMSWVLHRGSIPEGMSVLHNCPSGDNPACVNPDHLWLGTQADNLRDCFEKGRARRTPMQGAKHPQAKLDDATVRAIRASAASGSEGQEIARTFGVSKTTVSRILQRRAWKHLA